MRYETELMRTILTDPTARLMIDWVSRIYGESYVGLWLYQVIGAALTEPYAIGEGLLTETSPDTADLLLDLWEDHYGLPRDGGMTAEERRARLRLQTQVWGPCSPARLARAVSNALGGMAVTVDENTGPGRFTVRIQGGSRSTTQALAALDRVKPAHLKYDLRTDAGTTVWVGGAAASADVRMGERTMDANLRISISAVQPGTGDPAPDNPRPILPGLTLVRDNESELDVYGGELDTASGVLTVTHKAVELDGTESWSIAWGDTNPALYTILSNPADGENNSGTFSRFGYANVYSSGGVGAKCYLASGSFRFICRFDGQPETTTDWKALLAEWATDGKPLQAVYPLETPVTIQLTEAEVRRARLTSGCVAALPEDEQEG